MAVGTQNQYLSRLLETQRLRGVTAGEVFSSLLSSAKPGIPSPDEAMDTEPSTLRPTRRKQPANRTLSTLESRITENMNDDTDSFIRNVSLKLFTVNFVIVCLISLTQLSLSV